MRQPQDGAVVTKWLDRRVNQEVVFEVRRKASTLGNRKLRAIAGDLVLTGEASDRPSL